MITIDWQQMPPSPNDKEGEEYFFPRLKDNGSISFEELCAKAAEGNRFNRGEIYVAASFLIREIGRQLQEGRTVSIDKLGDFHLQIAANGKVGRQERNHKSAVKVRGIRFTPAPDLLSTAGEANFRWMPDGTGGRNVTDEVIRQGLITYFQDHDTLTRKDLETLFRLKRTTANYRLQALVKSGFLSPVGTNKNTKYTLKQA